MRERGTLLLFACVVLAAKLWLVATLGDAMPMGDQWPEEGAMFAKILQGRMPLADLFASHYEHRYVVTRLWDMAVWQLDNRVWNPPLQMVLNAGLHVLALVVLLHFLRPACSPRAWTALVVFTGFLFCLPFDYENTLNSFQSQIYFDLLFSFLFLHGLYRHAAWSPRWWLALACGVLAWLSHGAGVGTLVAGAAFLLLRLWRTADRDARSVAAALLVTVLAGFAVLATPASPPVYGVDTSTGAARIVQFAPRADSPAVFLRALWQVASWPSVLLAPLFYFPLLRLIRQQWQQPPERDDARWFVLAMGLWMLTMLALVAYGRGKVPAISRYTDFYALGLVLNFLCLWQPAAASAVPGRGQRWFAAAWLLLLLSCLLPHTRAELLDRAGLWLPQAQAVEEQVRLYLRTGNPELLAHNPFPLLPMVPSPAELRQMLDVAELREVLPPALIPAHALREPAWVGWLLGNLRTLALLLLTAGLGGALIGWLRPSPRASHDVAGAS